MAAASIGAAEIERASKEASKIVASLLTLPDLALTDDIRSWHPSNLSFGEAYALLWQQDDQGGTVSHSEDSNARLFAAHLIDLIVAGRVKLFWSSKKKLLTGRHKKLRLIVFSTEAVSVPATTTFLQQLNVLQQHRFNNGKNPIGLVEFIRHRMNSVPSVAGCGLEKQTFDQLVQRGILTKEKRKAWVFFDRTIYPTSDPAPEAMLVQDLRAVMKQEAPSTVQVELLLKLIAKTTELFSPEEAASDRVLLKQLEGFKHDASFTMLEKAGANATKSSPFTAAEGRLHLMAYRQ